MAQTINYDELVEDMLNMQADAIIEEVEVEVSEEEAKVKAANILSGFKDYFNSERFNAKVSEVRVKYGFSNDTLVKNVLIGNVLYGINKALNISVVIVGDAIKFISSLLFKLITMVVNLASGLLHRLINFLTVKRVKAA